MSDILSRIDSTLDGLCACGCGRPLTPHGPSGWWATEGCHRTWHLNQVNPEGAAARTARRRVRARQETISPASPAAREITQEDVDQAARHFNDGLRTFAEAMRMSLAEAGEQFSRVLESLREADLIPDEPPTDPRERALWHVRNRNTGPKPKPRAPRRIDPRKTR